MDTNPECGMKDGRTQYVIEKMPHVGDERERMERIAFDTEADRDRAWKLLELAAGKDGRPAFAGYAQFGANGYVFAKSNVHTVEV